MLQCWVKNRNNKALWKRGESIGLEGSKQIIDHLRAGENTENQIFLYCRRSGVYKDKLNIFKIIPGTSFSQWT